MKTTGRCPKCQGTSLWHITDVAANERTGSLQMQPTFQLAVVGKGPDGRAGALEAFACQGCGLVETYLKERLRADGEHVREIRRDPAPPYRG